MDKFFSNILKQLQFCIGINVDEDLDNEMEKEIETIEIYSADNKLETRKIKKISECTGDDWLEIV